MASLPGVLITDFDGTITDRDFYLLIMERYMGPGAMDIWDAYREGRISHFYAMQSFFSHAPTDEAELEALLRDTAPDPRFGEAARALQAAGWDLVIVSAGCSWYIERILLASGVRAAVHSNPGQIAAGKGLVMELATHAEFFDPDVGVDKSAVVEDALTRYERVAFAGDGPPDVKPALLVEPDRRFARGFLAEELTRRGERFVSFTAWHEAVTALLKQG
ncbi:MAG TPA: MtnX-like HAD-IB family phosphatase [Bryobacteraceae bacterium]|nr:MtnX-like HAD-IB family phosphatase [Bryobacteraceae bacterium]